MAENSGEVRHEGGCLCGGVRYIVTGPLQGVIGCHCMQCRRTSGHHVAATCAPTAALSLVSATTLTWYRSSREAERGFCKVCGGNLFWRRLDGTDTSIMAGTLDVPTGLAMEKHIFVRDKSDYYSIDDGLPCLPSWT